VADTKLEEVVNEIIGLVGGSSSLSIENLEKAANSAKKIVDDLVVRNDTLSNSAKARLAQELELLDALESTERQNALVIAQAKKIADGEEVLQVHRDQAQAQLDALIQKNTQLHNLLNSTEPASARRLSALREEIGYNNARLTQFKKLENIYKNQAIKQFANDTRDATEVTGKNRVAITELYKAVTNLGGVNIEDFLRAATQENALLEGITGVRGTLYGDYYGAMDAFTNSLDTGFRGIVRSGIRFTQNLKDIFESSIDPIVGLADTPAIRAATENMGGMFANIGLNGESAQKALTALKNSTSFLRESFIATGPAAEAAAAHFTNLTQGLAKLGIAEESTAVSLDFFVKGLKQTPKEASESVRALANMAHQLDINVSTAFQDFISLQGNLSQFGDDTTRVFGELQAQAVSTGVSVGDLNSIAERLDTFQGAAQAAQGFNAVLGQTVVSVTDLVHAEPAEKIQILKQALDRSGISFDSANRRIRSMIAGFMGVDVAKASKIFGAEDNFFTLRDNLDGSAASMQDLDERINQSMTNAEKMTKTLSSIGAASAQAIDRARENADTASRSLLNVITQMSEGAKQPLEVLISLRAALGRVLPTEALAAGIGERVTTTAAALGFAKTLIESGLAPSVVEPVLDAIGKIPGIDVEDIYHKEDGKIKLGKKPEARQFGGPTSAYTPYIVGESGPELFIPSTDGEVVSNRDMNAAGGVTVILKSPIMLQGTNGFVQVGELDQKIERKFLKAALNAPDPVVIA